MMAQEILARMSGEKMPSAAILDIGGDGSFKLDFKE
jgi:hypothetical protein